MIRQFLMAGLVPASFCVANPIGYSEAGANVAMMGTYARYGILQEINGFTLDTAVNLNTSFLHIAGISFSTAIYKNFDGWRVGPEFRTGLATYQYKKPFVYMSYAVRGVFDLNETWSATSSLGFHPAPQVLKDMGSNAWPIYSLGLQRRF